MVRSVRTTAVVGRKRNVSRFFAAIGEKSEISDWNSGCRATSVISGRTTPDYRLYALAGGPPKRPGLIRSPDGGSIALEVWAMPLARFGEFMEGIPSPLGIGTIRLEGGATVKGFLCESAGVEGAEDITHLGGWRAYLDQR